MNKVYYFHGINTNYNPIYKTIKGIKYRTFDVIQYTIAGKFNIDNDLELGISIVNTEKGDKFVKKTGRDQAYEQLFTNSILIASDKVEEYIKGYFELPRLVINNLHECESKVFDKIMDNLFDNFSRKQLIKFFNK